MREDSRGESRLNYEQYRGGRTAAKMMQVSVSGYSQQVVVRRSGQVQKGGGRRGRISRFSAGSRLRMFMCLAKICQGDFYGALWVSLTYERVMWNPVRSERDLETLFLAVLRKWGKVTIFWRRDLQERGSIHYHLIILGEKLFIPKGWLSRVWAGIVGEDHPFTRVERLYTWRGALYYCGKYMAKEDSAERSARAGAAEAAAVGAQPLGSTDITYSCGRQWGLKGKNNLKEPIKVLGAGYVTPERWRAARRYAKTVWKGVGEVDGWKLFVDWGGVEAQVFCDILGLCAKAYHSDAEEVESWHRSIHIGVEKLKEKRLYEQLDKSREAA